MRGINRKMIGFYGGIVYNRRKIFLLIKEIYGINILAALHGELQSLDSKFMRGAEPVVRV